jgi:hypothetical protein
VLSCARTQRARTRLRHGEAVGVSYSLNRARLRLVMFLLAGLAQVLKQQPKGPIRQNNSIVISVCTLACAARFRANAVSKSVGMIGRPHAQPLLRRNNVYRAVAVSLPSAKSGQHPLLADHPLAVDR